MGGCAATTPPPVVTPPNPTVTSIFTSESTVVNVTDAECVLTLDGVDGGPYDVWAEPTTTSTVPVCLFTFPPGLHPWGASLTVSAEGYVSQTVQWTLCLTDCAQQPITLVPLLPPAPTRWELLGAPGSFQGVTCVTQQYGSLPLFDVAIASFNSADRQSCYQAHQALGDKIISLAVSWS